MRGSRVLLASLAVAGLATPLAALALVVRLSPGLIGAQDAGSKALEALSPAAADRTARRDLMGVLHTDGRFTLDNSRNVEAMAFVTKPYAVDLPGICREDRVTLRYELTYRPGPGGRDGHDERSPQGVEAQALYRVGPLPVPGVARGGSYRTPDCGAPPAESTSAWFAAPSDLDALRAANLFAWAVEGVKAGRTTPAPCEAGKRRTCRQWIAALDDPRRIRSVAPCAPDPAAGAGLPPDRRANACYAITVDDSVLTVSGVIPDNAGYSPTEVTSVKVEAILDIMV